jgi:pimeloyl-ACP methyl ester carboxylesterase
MIGSSCLTWPIRTAKTYLREPLAGLAEQVAAQVTSARAVILDQAGHMAHIDDPAGWLTAVASFLAED